MTHDSTSVAGIDIGKQWLDAACHPSGISMRVENTPTGHRHPVDWLTRHAMGRVGLEASGGYERGVAAAFRAAGFEVAVLRRARSAPSRCAGSSWPRATGSMRRSRCTAEIETVRTPPDPQLEPLA